MPQKLGMIGEILEQGGSLVKQTGKQLAQTPGNLAQGAAAQIGVKPTPSQTPSPTEQTQANIKVTQEFVKDLYGATDSQDKNVQAPKQPQANDQKSLEDQKKMIELRQQLHKEKYYDPTFNRPQLEEERVAEKNEREEQEKKMEALEEQKKEEKDKEIPLAVQQANKTEKNRGVSG